MHATTLTLVTAVALGAPVPRSSSATYQNRASIDLCIVSAIHDVEVPAEVAGPLSAVAVEEGTVVQSGALLGQIDDRKARLDKDTAEMRRDAALEQASSQVNVQIAEATFGVAQEELDQRLKIKQRSRNAISDSEIRQLELARDRSKYEIERAKLEMRVAKLTADAEEAAVKVAERDIEQRKILSPVAGEVATVIRQRGEWVSAGDPVFRVIRMDQLHVEGIVSAREFNPGELVDCVVTVQLELARGRKVKLAGQVVHLSPIVKAGSKYRIRAKVNNQREHGLWLLRPGATVSMAIHLR